MKWRWRSSFFFFPTSDFPRIVYGHGRQKLSMLLSTTNRKQFSLVCTLIDHRNNDKMFKTLQWNHSPAPRGSTWVLNILTSFLWSIRVQTMENCCPLLFNFCCAGLCSIKVQPRIKIQRCLNVCSMCTPNGGQVMSICCTKRIYMFYKTAASVQLGTR